MANQVNVSLPIEVSGQTHYIAVNKTKEGYQVSVDGIYQNTYKSGTGAAVFGEQIDLPAIIDGYTYYVAVRKNTMRIVANGVYIDNGEPFEPAKPMPSWIWVFVVLLALIPIISLGGIFNFIIGFVGIFVCGLVARSNIKSTTGKVLACVGVTVAFWVIWFLVNLIIGAAMYG